MRYLLSVLTALTVLCGPLPVVAHTPTTITLRELGILQLAAHDLFRVDRELEENLENDMLDLSTIFDHGDDLIPVGGEIRNSENVAVFTVSQGYVNDYLLMIEQGTEPATARERVVRHFHGDLMHAVRNMIEGRIPEPMTGPLTMTDDLAFRVIHDLIPGSVMVNDAITPILSPSLFRHVLHDSELDTYGEPMDGVVNEVFRFITFFTPEGLVVVDLIERDHSFAEQFHTDYSFQYFLDESSDGRLDRTDEATRLIGILIAKGLGNYEASLEQEEGETESTPDTGTDTSTTTDSTEENSGGNTTEDGADGADGEDGSDGTDGADGGNGTSGSEGASGADGADGADEPTVTLTRELVSPSEREMIRDTRRARDVR